MSLLVERVRIGVGVLVLNNNNILLGKRLSEYNNGVWAVPAGHMELGETFVQTAIRELWEETGLIAKKLELIGLNNYSDEKGQRQYVNIDFLVKEFDGFLQNKEPDLCAGWKWFPLNNLPFNISTATNIAIKSMEDGYLCVTEPAMKELIKFEPIKYLSFFTEKI